MGVSTDPRAGDDRPVDVVIVGGGLAGLACARTLIETPRPIGAAPLRVRLLESSDRVGGRLRTEVIDDFRIDRGFQVLLTAYPECRATLDYRALRLGRFFSGADVRTADGVHRLADPWRHPIAGVRSLAAPILGWRDALRVATLRRQCQGRVNPVAGEDVPTTRAFLEGLGFSERAIARFFVPFFGGIFLERELETPSSMFAFLYAMFAEGHAALPAEGMEAIPRQMAAALPEGTVRTNARVHHVESGHVVLAGGERIHADHVVIATDASDASDVRPDLRPTAWRSTVQIAFAAEAAPFDDPILMLDAEGDGPVHHAVVPSSVAPTYAPAGAALVTLTHIGDPDLDDDAVADAARTQVRGWFGPAVDDWRCLRVDRVRRALPVIRDANRADDRTRFSVVPGVWRCGDALENASINGAMVSGRRCAEALLAAVAPTD